MPLWLSFLLRVGEVREATNGHIAEAQKEFC